MKHIHKFWTYFILAILMIGLGIAYIIDNSEAQSVDCVDGDGNHILDLKCEGDVFVGSNTIFVSGMLLGFAGIVLATKELFEIPIF